MTPAELKLVDKAFYGLKHFTLYVLGPVKYLILLAIVLVGMIVLMVGAREADEKRVANCLNGEYTLTGATICEPYGNGMRCVPEKYFVCHDP